MIRKVSVVVFASLLASTAFAGSSDSHTVTVTVQAINEIAIAGGNQTLTINSATAGADPDDATNGDASLAWTSNETGRKITVASDLASPIFDLTVEATGVTGGTSAGAVAPGTVAADLVTGISETTGGATLSYSASATAADGTGSDVHVLTYTITAAL